MKFICVGRNYADHAKELGNKVEERPIIFLKPETAFLKNNQPFFHPEFSTNIQHEIELVVRISKHGKHIEPQFANRYYEEVTLGLDFTARDLQTELKNAGHPWELAKAFDNSAVVGDFVPVSSLDSLDNLEIKLTKNGEVVQLGNTVDMIFKIDFLVSYVSKFFSLKQGDMIFTGTPAGVGKINVNDELEGFLNGQKLLHCPIR